jgi:hypothetical protein
VIRWPKVALVALAVYGVSMGAAGVALAVSPPGTPTPDRDGIVSVLGSAEDEAADPLVDDADPTGRPVGAAPLVAPGGRGRTLVTPSVPVPAGSVPSARRATVAAGQRATFVPTRIVLPSGEQAPVLPSGVQPDGSLVIPERPDVVGWWDGGARAGDPMGSLVIAGHVDSRRYGLGVLAEIKRLQQGAVLELRSGNQRLRYRVYRAVQVNQQSLAQDDEFFRQDSAHRLVVITCGGPFDQTRHRYRDNYIVMASPVLT